MGRKGTKKGKKAQLKGNGTRREKRAAVNKKRTRRGARRAHRKPRRSIKQKRGGNPEDSRRRIEQIESKLKGLLGESYTLAEKTYDEIRILNLTPEEEIAIINGVGKSAEREETVKRIFQEYNLLHAQLLARMSGAIGHREQPIMHLARMLGGGGPPRPWEIAHEMLKKKIKFMDKINDLLVTTSNSLDELKDKYTAELGELKKLASPPQSNFFASLYKKPSDDTRQSLAKEYLQNYGANLQWFNRLKWFFVQEVEPNVRKLKRLLKDLKTVVEPYADIAKPLPDDYAPLGQSQDANIEDKS